MIVLTDKHHLPFEIDEADYEAVSRYAWHIVNGYPWLTQQLQERKAD